VPNVRISVAQEPTDPEIQQAYREMNRHFAGVPNVMAAFANHPKIFKGIWPLVRAIFLEGAVEPRLRELIWLSTSIANRCHY
jgi:hypothetical protein